MIRKRSDFFVEGVWPISRGKLLILGIVSHVSPLSFIQKTISSKQKPFPRKFSRVYHKYDRSRKNFSHTLTHFSRVFSNFLTTLLTLPPNRNFTFPHPTPPTSPPPDHSRLTGFLHWYWHWYLVICRRTWLWHRHVVLLMDVLGNLVGEGR